jgi:hypothetical protein
MGYIIEKMTIADESRLMQLLDERHTWPGIYTFKFIVPQASSDALREVLPEAEKVETRPSSGGKYTAYTFHCPMGSSREVLDVYARVHGSQIPGLISL